MTPSANGFLLDVGGIEIAAAWPAPYFVLVLDEDDPAPMLIHCDSLDHAQRHAALGGILLDSTFSPVNPAPHGGRAS